MYHLSFVDGQTDEDIFEILKLLSQLKSNLKRQQQAEKSVLFKPFH